MGTETDPQPDYMQSMRDHVTLIPKWNVPIKSLPSGLWSTLCKRKQTEWKSQVDERHKALKVSLIKYIWTDRDWGFIHGLDESASDGVLEVKGEVDTWLTIMPNPEPISNWQSLANEHLILSKGVFLGNKILLWADSIFSSRRPTGNDLRGIFWGSLSHIVV